MIASANKAFVGIGKETTEGTAVAVAPIHFSECDVKGVTALMDMNYVTGRDAVEDQISGVLSVSGSLKTDLEFDGFALLLQCMFPQAATELAFRPNRAAGADVSTIQPSFTLIKKFNDLDTAYTYAGCKVKSLGIEIDGSAGPIPVVIEVEGISETAAGTVSAPGAPTILKNQNIASMSEGGSALPSGTKLSLKIDFGLDADIAFTVGNGGKRKTIDANQMSVTGTLTALCQDTSLIAKQLARTESSLSVVLLNGTKKLTIAIPKLKYEPSTPPIQGKKGILLSIPFRAYVANDTDKIITFQAETIVP